MKGFKWMIGFFWFALLGTLWKYIWTFWLNWLKTTKRFLLYIFMIFILLFAYFRLWFVTILIYLLVLSSFILLKTLWMRKCWESASRAGRMSQLKLAKFLGVKAEGNTRGWEILDSNSATSDSFAIRSNRSAPLRERN